jgi:hypothetical protein
VQQPAAARDPGDLERALQPSFPRRHPRASCGTTTTPCPRRCVVAGKKDAGSPLGRRLNLLPRETVRSVRGGFSSEVRPHGTSGRPERSLPGRVKRVLRDGTRSD